MACRPRFHARVDRWTAKREARWRYDPPTSRSRIAKAFMKKLFFNFGHEGSSATTPFTARVPKEIAK